MKLLLRVAWLVLGLTGAALAEPVVVARCGYPEGLLWHGGRMLFAEMGTGRVSLIEGANTRTLWREDGCGPTAIAPFGADGFLVNCHLGQELVEITAEGIPGRRFRNAPDGTRLQAPNASTADGAGGVYFSDSGIFSVQAPATGRVYHLSAAGVLTQIASGLKYTNGVAFDAPTRGLFVSEHLARRVLVFRLRPDQSVASRRVFADFARHAASRAFSYPEAGPDGLALHSGLLAVPEYGQGRVHLFSLAGRLLRTLKVPMPFVTTVAWDSAGHLYAGGAFQNERPPYEGVVVRFSPNEWRPVRR